MTKTRRTKWRVLVLAGAATIAGALALGACGGGDSDTSSSPTSETPKAGGTYNYALSANPVSIEPLNAQESEGMQVAHQVFQGLVKYEMNDAGEMVAVPDIAEEWSTTDSITWTFKLKQGVMFQAPVSREVKAQDFVDSWTRVTDRKNQSYVSYILAPVEGCDDGGYQVDTKKGLTGVKAVDDYTLEVKLRYTFAEFAQTLGHTVAAATPVEYIEKVGDKEFDRKPIGTGPYMVESWKDNQSVELVKNPDYWDKDNAGYVDRIHMPIILEPNTQWLEFQKGTIDYSVVPSEQVSVAEAHPNVKSGEWSANRWPALSIYFVGMNMTDPVLRDDLELRKALIESANAQAVIDQVWQGVHKPATGIVPEGIPGYVAGQSPYSYSPEDAKAIIAGMSDVPDLSFWYNTDSDHQKIAEVLQAGWKDAGVEVKLSNFEWGTFLDKLSKGNQDSGSQLFRMGWIADYPSMDNFLYPLFQSDQARTGSYTFYANDTVDDLLIEARQTVDTEARHALYAQAEKQILTDAPAIPLYYYRDFRVTNNRIGGFVHNPMGFTDMWTVWVK